MESKRHERGHRSRSDTGSPTYQDNHKRSHKHHSPSPVDYRSGKSSRNGSSERRRRRRSNSKQRTRKRSRSSERSERRRHTRRGRTSSRSRRSRSRDRRRSRSSRSISRSTTNSRSRSRSRSRGRRDRDRNRDNRRHHRGSIDSDHHGEQSETKQTLSQLPVIPPQSNAFKNDGSFMEMFKKMQEQMQPVQKPTTSILEEKPVAPPPLMVGKRRGGRILKTGMVAKAKTEEKSEQPKDAWSLYMAEVKKYREVCCQEEDNTRPLVK